MRRRGFTLLETLVALAVLGLVLAFYGGTLRLMLAALGRQGGSVEASDAHGATDRTLRRLIDAMQPASPSATPPPPFEAGPHRLRLVTRLPGLADPIDALLERDAAGRLLLAWSPQRHVRRLAPAPPPTVTEIAADIAALDLSYFRAGRWTASLPAGQYPELVRIRVTPRDGRPGADLVAAPRLDAPL